jgi:hypothetical protein
MDPWDRPTFLRHLVSALGRGVLIAIVLPLLPAIFLAYSLPATLALIGSGLVLEYGAAPAGLVLGLPPLFVFYVLMCTETGIFLGLFDIFDTIGHTSPRVAGFLDRTKEFVHRHSLAEKYGILGLVPCEVIVGVYANAPVSWVLGWKKYPALLITMAAYSVCLVITILAAVGFFQAFFPGVVHP